MKVITALLVCSSWLHFSSCMEVKNSYQTIHTDIDGSRDRRDVIEEEKFYNYRTDVKKDNLPKPWIPGPLPPDDPTTRVSLTMGEEPKESQALFQTTERVTDKPTSRGARASNENWIKLPYPGRDEEERDNILTPPQPSGDLVNSRMPRINFVTQNKVLEASESRNDKESIQRSSRNDDVRTEFVRPDQEPKTVKPVYPRQATYYPEESRRAPYYNDRYNPINDYRRDPYLDSYDRQRYYPGLPRADRYNEQYDNYISRKPKRIIYYAHLPEVVRTPPSVDLRYRYSADPYRRYDDDYSSARSGRYDYRFRNRYPYAPLRKEDRIYRDLAGAGTTNKDKKVEQKVTAAPVLPQKDDARKSDAGRQQPKNLINSHQYHDTMDVHFNDQLIQKGFEDVVRPDHGYLRYEEPLFQSAIDDPYRQKYY